MEPYIVLMEESDAALARALANSLSGQCSEWPQLRPLLRRLADTIEEQQKVIDDYRKQYDIQSW